MLPFLAIAALTAFLGALLLIWTESAAPAAALHLAFAAGVMPLILGAMTYFVPVLTRSPGANGAIRALPLLALGAGALVSFSFAYPARAPLGDIIAATAAMLAATILSGWMLRRGAASFGRPHPGLYWYPAALLCLLAALAAVLAMHFWPEQRPALKRLHLHLNMLGFVAITAVGTLQVLLPTVTGRADDAAATRLHADLKWALAGALFLAAGAAWVPALAWAGAVLWAIPLARLARAWLTQFRNEIFQLHGAAPALAAALAGLALALLAGALHAAGVVPTANAIYVFLAGFLLPLVTGALSHLLPLWLRPGAPTRVHEELRRRLTRGGGVRAMLFLGAGILLGGGLPQGLALAGAGLALFLAQLAHALVRRQHATD